MLNQHSLTSDASNLPAGMEWLANDCAERGGFFIETEHHMISYTPGEGRLVVGFDNLSSNREKEKRVPFGFDLCVRQGWGVLGVMVKRMDWFQCPDVKDKLVTLREKGLFSSYDHVSMYGSSMGGFGAMAFAPLAPGATVLAIAPQSTLRPKIATFERRYNRAVKVGDWSGDFTDAARTVSSIGKAYMIYDPFVPEDKAHAKRLAHENVMDLPVRHFTHKVPPMFRRMEILKGIALDGMSGELSRPDFYSRLRARRNAPPYLISLIGRAQEKGHLDLGLLAAEKAVQQVNNWKTRQALKNMREANSEAK